MQVIENEMIVGIDVDKTLVEPSAFGPIQITNPYSNTTDSYRILTQHVELLKQYHGRGMFVVVWSAGGVLWAKTVIEILGLTDYVHLVQTKPIKIVDDLPPEKIFTTRVYLPDELGDTDEYEP